MCCGFAVKTRASLKNRSSFRLAIFLCSPTDRFHAPFTAKPGHISQSPRSALGAMRLNISIGIRDGSGPGENQRFLAMEVASTRLECVMHHAPARHKFLFPVQKVSNGHVCVLASEKGSTVAAATVNSVEMVGRSRLWRAPRLRSVSVRRPLQASLA